MKFLFISSVCGLLLMSCSNDETSSVSDDSYADEMIEVIELDVNETLQTAFKLALKNGTNLDIELPRVEEALGKKSIVKVGDYYWLERDDGGYIAPPDYDSPTKLSIKTIDLNGAKAVKKFMDTK